AEHVFHDENVEIPRTAKEIQRLRVDIIVRGRDVGIVLGDLVENLAEKGHRTEDVRLVDAGDMARPAIRLAFAGKLESEAVQALAPLARDPERIADLVIGNELAAIMRSGRKEQALRRFPQHDQVNS